MPLLRLAPAAALLLAACDQSSPPPAEPVQPSQPEPPAAPPAPPAAAPAAPAAAKPAALPGEAMIRARWAAADNRATCAPLFLTDVGDARVTARRADFSGGWGVAFDRADFRSLYGIAGTGVVVDDAAAWASKVAAQWPYRRKLGGGGGLPQASLAGYGLEGLADYRPANPLGRGRKSLAYVVVPGQACLYNVWSHLGRDHLERLLDGLTLGT